MSTEYESFGGVGFSVSLNDECDADCIEEYFYGNNIIDKSILDLKICTIYDERVYYIVSKKTVNMYSNLESICFDLKSEIDDSAIDIDSGFGVVHGCFTY